MKGMMAVCAMVLTIASAGALTAHHSLANHDTTIPVRVKGTVIEIRRINPHSFISLDQTNADGVRQRWAVEGPAELQLARRGIPSDVLKPGDVIEVCGYLTREKTIWQIAGTAPETASVAGRLITAELLVMPDGREQSWGDYGVHRCFAAGFTDQHSK